MFNTFRKVLFLNLCILCVPVANAVTIDNLYEVSVPVSSQSKNDRKNAISQAFEVLLVRITGKRDVLNLPEGQTLLRQSRRFVHSFRYESPLTAPAYDNFFSPVEVPVDETIHFGFSREVDTTEPFGEVEPFSGVEDATVDNELLQMMIVSFDEKAVKNSLWKHSLPVWGKTRPTTLLWIAGENASERIMLDAKKMTEMLALFNEQSDKRGLPLAYPRFDSTDESKVNVTDILGAYSGPILNASSQYPVEATVAASFLFDDVEGWQTRWTLYHDNGETSWRVAAPELDIVIFEGIDKLSSILADSYAQTSSGNNTDRFLIYIQDVLSLADYDKINQYLDAISVVKRASLVQVKGNELIYELELRSSSKALKQAIALGKVLITQDDPFADEIDIQRLTYRFKP